MYRMPFNAKEVESFQKDPVAWMKAQIEENLPTDPIAQNVFKLANKHGIKTRKKEFYIMLAFIALLNNQMVTVDFQRYRLSNPNQQQRNK